MRIEVSPETEASIARLIESGAFPDPTGVVDEAVRKLAETDAAYVNGLQQKVDRGRASLASNGGTPWTSALADRLIGEGLARQQNRRSPS